RMINHKCLFFTLSLLFVTSLGWSQQIESQDAYEYNHEFIWGINKNTAGGLIGGFVLKWSKSINERVYQTIGFELVNIKHPQETRENSNITGNFFIFGKTNYLYSIRSQYGRDIILFRKAPQKGVEIKALLAAGPSIGLLAPYFVDYAVGGQGGPFIQSERVPYQPEIHRRDLILGTGRLFQGIQDSELRIGANFKAGLSFEFGTFKTNVSGFEVGFLLDAYSGDVVLVPGAENSSVFPTAYLTLFYGSRK
ncbi:MAG: hypothetical protein AAFX87_25810, partial [Bacteroidota bacterium]